MIDKVNIPAATAKDTALNTNFATFISDPSFLKNPLQFIWKYFIMDINRSKIESEKIMIFLQNGVFL